MRLVRGSLSLERVDVRRQSRIDKWSHDLTSVNLRALELIRFGHMVAGPAVVLGLLILAPGSPLVFAALAYVAGLVAALRLLPRWQQPVALAMLDVVLMGLVGASDPRLWLAFLAPCIAAMTLGWLVGQAGTWALFVVGISSMTIAGFEVRPEGWFVTLIAFGCTGAALNFYNLRILGQGREGVLKVTDLVESLPVIVWESDVSTGVLTRAVGWIEELLGYQAEDWRALPAECRVHQDDLSRYFESIEMTIESAAPVTHEYRLRCVDGSAILVREVMRRVETGDRVFLRGVILDIADEAAAREVVDRLAAVVAHQLEPLLVVAAREAVEQEPLVLQANPAFATLAGVDAEAVSGHELAAIAPWLPRTVRADLDDFLASGRVADRDDVEFETPKGRRIFDYVLVGLPDRSVAVQFADVTERRNATELIRHQAFHDPLTTLPNRTLFFDRLTHALNSMPRDRNDVGLLLLDLDQFKEINDTLGHMQGDQLLTTIGTRLSVMSREVDTVARLGGDEFAMVVVGATEVELAEIADRVVMAVKQPVALDSIEVEISASIGGAIAPVHGNDALTLLQRADVAMYDAKRSGVPFKLYTRDDDRHSHDRLTLMGELRNLLDDQLRVWFQPKIDLRTGHALELEALARWQHPRLGLLGPAQFMELCEVSGIIAELTFRVLDLAIEAMANWPELRVAVNVPVRNLYDRNLPTLVGETLQRHGVNANRLILEITEREIMEDHRAIFEVLEELHESGVRISIDDFGTGFSSLSHLRRLPISEIKIDRSFISGMLDRENDYIIARSIIDLAHNLGHRVVAEGVEDTATLELLRGLGCDVAQGFLFSRPGPADRIRRQIDAGPALAADGSLAWGGAAG